MVQVVLSLEKDVNKTLRELAHILYEGKKGSMSKVVEDALLAYKKELDREKAFKKLLYMAKNARDLGVGKFKREEAYE